MLDLHCHILPGVDDGPHTLTESLAMARFCVADGITHIAATPHCNRPYRLLRADVVPYVARFHQELAAEKIPLAVLPGSEIQLRDPAEYRRDYEAGVLCHLGDDPTYSLLEFAWQERFYPADAPGFIRWLVGKGTTPILAHPERYDFFQDDPDRLRAVVEAGAWLQITVDSLLGNHGPDPQTAGEEMLRTYPEAVLSTDAHSLLRCSGLSAGFAWVGEHLGADREEDLRRRADRILRRLLAAAAGPARPLGSR